MADSFGAIAGQVDRLTRTTRNGAYHIQANPGLGRGGNPAGDGFDLLETPSQMPDNGGGQHRKTADAGER